MTNLQAHELSLGYRNFRVVENFDVEISGGTTIGLVGPNGSGKTTLLRAFAGLLKPFHGTISLDGQNLNRLPSRQRARILGWVPQQERLAWPLTVKEVVALGRAPHRGWLLPLTRVDQDVIERVIEFTEMTPLADRRVDELSGGEFQRVLIARALAQEPQMLLLDEPTANLDIHHQFRVMDMVRELVVQHKITAVIAIHDLNLAARYCDILILMHAGKKVCAGSPAEVLTPENVSRVFNVESQLYHDPWNFLAVSARNGVARHD
jgi:iron complex transport system ATP-binding protein